MAPHHATYSQIKTISQQARIFPIAGTKTVSHTPVRDVIAFSTRKRIEMVRVTEICYVQAEDNYSRIHMIGRQPILLSKTLKEMDSILDHEGFIRVHQSYLVHPAQVLSYDFTEKMMTLRNGVVIPVSRANSKRVSIELLNWGAKN